MIILQEVSIYTCIIHKNHKRLHVAQIWLSYAVMQNKNFAEFICAEMPLIYAERTLFNTRYICRNRSIEHY